MTITAVIAAGLAAAILAAPLTRVRRNLGGIFSAAVPLCAAAFFLTRFPAVVAGDVARESYRWAPSLGVRFSFQLDALSLLFALLITVVGTLVFVYAHAYLGRHAQLGRFYAFLLTFMSAMLGLVLADNLLTLFVFWELTSISSYLLIGFHHQGAASRAAALQALLVTGGGGLALLAGLLLLGQMTGTYELSEILGHGDAVRGHSLYLPALMLILIGAFTKSAQFPFHFWLPSAMEAPTPVSAYLHSATMVKAGIYLLARLSPVLGGSDAWFAIVSSVGCATMLMGAWLSLHENDLKKILAYSTISALGTLTMLLGIGGAAPFGAMLVFLAAHAAYKGALFLVAGAIDHETGTRDVERLGGLAPAMPQTALWAATAALSMAGIPPLFGFLAKEMFYETTLHAPAAIVFTTASVAANMLLFVAAAVCGLRPFFGRTRSDFAHVHEAPPGLRLGPAVLGLVTIVAAPAAGWGLEGLVATATAAAVGHAEPPHLRLWHGFNFALGLSVVTLLGGAGVYAARGWFLKIAPLWAPVKSLGPARGYAAMLAGLNAVAAGQTRLLQNGILRHYLLIVLATAVVLVGGTLIARVPLPRTLDFTDLHFYDVGLVVLIVSAAVAAIVAQSRLAAIAALGVVGYCVALVFVLFGAPDVAMTQFLIETLTVIVFVSVFYHLPKSPDVSTGAVRARDAVVALTVGLLMTTLVIVATNVQFHPSISGYYLEHGPVEAHGRNIVNVILVDFRALDTLGEITVLAVAAVGVRALYGMRRARLVSAPTTEWLRVPNEASAGSSGTAAGGVVASSGERPDANSPDDSPTTERNRRAALTSALILPAATRLMLPLLLLFSVFLLLRGHHLPGGGFSGGLVAASAFVLYGFAFGVAESRRALGVDPRTFIGIGLIVALASGLLALLPGRPYLTGVWGYLGLSAASGIPLGTPLLFDIGVYLVVVGVTTLILLTLAEE